MKIIFYYLLISIIVIFILILFNFKNIEKYENSPVDVDPVCNAFLGNNFRDPACKKILTPEKISERMDKTDMNTEKALSDIILNMNKFETRTLNTIDHLEDKIVEVDNTTSKRIDTVNSTFKEKHANLDDRLSIEEKNVDNHDKRIKDVENDVRKINNFGKNTGKIIGTVAKSTVQTFLGKKAARKIFKKKK